MKLLVCCFILVLLVVCPALAELETCSEVTECSESMKNKCVEMSQGYKDSGNKEFVLTCSNGICMCTIQFVVPEPPIVNDTCQIKDKEPTEDQ